MKRLSSSPPSPSHRLSAIALLLGLVALSGLVAGASARSWLPSFGRGSAAYQLFRQQRQREGLAELSAEERELRTNHTRMVREYEEHQRHEFENDHKYFHEPASHEAGADDTLGHYDTRFFSGKPLDYADKHDTQVHMVRAFLELFRRNGIETWLAHGTLLGWWWNEQLLPWDWDVDAQVSEATLFWLGDNLNNTRHTYTAHVPVAAIDRRGGRRYCENDTEVRDGGDGSRPCRKRILKEEQKGLDTEVGGKGEGQGRARGRGTHNDSGTGEASVEEQQEDAVDAVDDSSSSVSGDNNSRDNQDAVVEVTRTYLLDVNPNAATRTNGDGFNIIDARWINVHNGLYIDITGLSELEPRESPGWIGCKNWHRYRVRDIYPLRETMFEGVPASVPYSYATILADEYESAALVKTEFEGHKWDRELNSWIKLPINETEIEEPEENHEHG